MAWLTARWHESPPRLTCGSAAMATRTEAGKWRGSDELEVAFDFVVDSSLAEDQIGVNLKVYERKVHDHIGGLVRDIVVSKSIWS